MPLEFQPRKKKNSAQKQVGVNNCDAVCRNQRQNVHKLSVNTLSSTSLTKSNHKPDGCYLEKNGLGKKTLLRLFPLECQTQVRVESCRASSDMNQCWGGGTFRQVC